MAVDKKSDHVGNHGGTYIDNDGQSKQFTYIDHDKKTKVAPSKPLSEDERASLKDSLKQYEQNMIEEILAFPAVNAVRNPFGLYEEFVIRSESGITWHEQMVREACSINDTLRRNLHTQLWRRTVKEQFWFEDMSH
jgi:hypothetical protein